AQGTFRIDIPKKIPFYLETEFTYNNWNYFESGQIFLENTNPTFIKQFDRRILLKTGVPSGRNAKTEAFAGFFTNGNTYSPTDNFTTGDILDQSTFDGFVSGISYKKSQLNRKQYASKGSLFTLGLTYFEGYEDYTPGNILRNEPNYSSIKPTETFRRWFKLNFNISPKFSTGYLFEGILSNKPTFSTFKNNLLNTAAFYPLQDTKTLFLQNLRADNFLAGGLRNVYSIRKNFDLRLEAYIFQPFKEILLNGNQQTQLGSVFADQRFVANSALVYHTPVGPIALNFNYYDDRAKRFGIFFHIGYLIYNKRVTEL
ncbi:patatin, partial [Pelobium sp.]|nr:patatin [Pelobium sp.]